jgi:alpha-tubulin suppressor-like RCC1 family protein
MLYDPQSPKQVETLKGKKIVDIACGTNHCLALDDTGALYTWGCGGYGRLGLNETPPKDNLVPVEISGFKDRSNPVRKIACGNTCSMAIDSTVFD